MLGNKKLRYYDAHAKPGDTGDEVPASVLTTYSSSASPALIVKTEETFSTPTPTNSMLGMLGNRHMLVYCRAGTSLCGWKKIYYNRGKVMIVMMVTVR